jgi:hypothetical protein
VAVGCFNSACFLDELLLDNAWRNALRIIGEGFGFEIKEVPRP